MEEQGVAKKLSTRPVTPHASFLVPRKRPPRLTEFESLVEALNNDRPIIRVPAPPPRHAAMLMETLGAIVVIDPSAPPVSYRMTD